MHQSGQDPHLQSCLPDPWPPWADLGGKLCCRRSSQGPGLGGVGNSGKGGALGAPGFQSPHSGPCLLPRAPWWGGQLLWGCVPMAPGHTALLSGLRALRQMCPESTGRPLAPSRHPVQLLCPSQWLPPWRRSTPAPCPGHPVQGSWPSGNPRASSSSASVTGAPPPPHPPEWLHPQVVTHQIPSQTPLLLHQVPRAQTSLPGLHVCLLMLFASARCPERGRWEGETGVGRGRWQGARSRVGAPAGLPAPAMWPLLCDLQRPQPSKGDD